MPTVRLKAAVTTAIVVMTARWPTTRLNPKVLVAATRVFDASRPATKQSRSPTLVGRPVAWAAAANTTTCVGVSAPMPCRSPIPNDDHVP